VSFLAAIALDVRDGEAEDFDFGEALFDGFEAVGLDDGGDPFHGGSFGVLSVAIYVSSVGIVPSFKRG
jgi:hypothetical protein